MIKTILAIASFTFFISNTFASPNIEKAKKQMIRNSIRNYSGNCPCPYSKTKRGHRCGKRSAYSRPGGASPLCYKNDISNEMAKKYLKQQGK